MIVYKKTNGVAHDLTFKSPDILDADDIIYGEGDTLPDIMTLHDQSYLNTLAQKELEQIHKQEYLADNLPSWAVVGWKFDTMLTNATAATNLAQAKAVLIELITFLKKSHRAIYWQIKDSEE